jgi:uncharacterized protein YigA (DUF484 family)
MMLDGLYRRLVVRKLAQQRRRIRQLESELAAAQAAQRNPVTIHVTDAAAPPKPKP